MKKKALISGISGQDGSYLAEFLLKKNYIVHGIVRKVSLEDKNHKLWRLKNIFKKIKLHSASLDSFYEIAKLIKKIKPNEFYHLAAYSYVNYSLDNDCSIFESNLVGTQTILSVIKEYSPKTKIFFAGSSEMFGNAKQTPQNEKSLFNPRSAYGVSKVRGYKLIKKFREDNNLFCCTGILYNHESPRKNFEFVTRKITYAAARIKLGLENKLELGNIFAKRDWGHAKDYVKAMWLMLQNKKPEDFVISTGELHSVKEFLTLAFSFLGLDYKKYIVINKTFFRPKEKKQLVGNSTKAKKKLKWKPKIKFKDLVKEMVNADIDLIRKHGKVF